ncbi:MAG: hypothetical protein KDB63_03845 [Nocardioidaceae bacterium]|nr:hypothetical protein [Nocardioidaceae bacterium]
MSTDPRTGPSRLTGHVSHVSHDGHDGHRGHALMMLVCCIPMLAVAALLVATGTASTGAVVWVLGCVAMMAVMTRAMPGRHDE